MLPSPTPDSPRTHGYWPWFIGGTAGVMLLILFISWMLTPAAKRPQPVVPPSLPQAGPQEATTTLRGGNSLSIPINSGSAIATKDFLIDPATVSDPTNPGYYYVGYHQSTGPQDTTATANPPYVIEYIATTHYFNIALYQEPIGQTRHDAELYLMNALGITQDQMCTLKYMVSVPENVNATYASENLGFSFCPNATQLP